jgi:hypothetical protein
MATDYKGPYQIPFIVVLKPAGKIQGVKITVTAKLSFAEHLALQLPALLPVPEIA